MKPVTEENISFTVGSPPVILAAIDVRELVEGTLISRKKEKAAIWGCLFLFRYSVLGHHAIDQPSPHSEGMKLWANL